MAPGAGGGGGRPTGTVPKTKMYDTGRDQCRDHAPPLNHVSNNLLGLDWQAAQTYDRRTRKNSNRSFSDHYELPLMAPMDDSGSSHDNRSISATYTPPDGSQWSSPGRPPHDVEVSGHSRDLQPQCNIMCDKSNISKMTDRREVVSRLNQICDYIKQTSYLMDTLKNSENSNLVELDSNCSSARGSVGISPGSNLSLSRASSQTRRQSASAAELLQTCDREELRMKVEESQRKLQALQEHQAALAALQDKARQQLHEARQEQSALMIRCSVGDGEASVDDTVKLDQLQQRLQNLAEMCHNRNQLAAQLGEADGEEEMLPEQLVLQNKLQQLQSKKQHMDHLVATLHNTSNNHNNNSNNNNNNMNNNNSTAITSTPVAAAAVSTTTTGGAREPVEDSAVVRDKLAELSIMKQQLAHLKDLVASVERSKQCAVDGETEEQAVNLRRQNMRGSSEGEELATDVQARTQRLRDAQGRLQQLQELMGLVGEAHASGRPLPDQYIDMLLRETTSASSSSSPPHHRSASQESGRGQLDKNTAQDKELYSSTVLREKKTNSQSQRQLLALELQAKRLELEALMSKDQGLASAINHDKPHPLLAGYGTTPLLLGEGTTSGTWGGSTRDTIDDMADPDPDLRDHSLCYSSDEAAEEEEDSAEQLRGLHLGASVLGQSSATNRDTMGMSLSLDTAPSPLPLAQPQPGCVASRLSWVASQEAVCSQPAPPPLPAGDYVPASVGHASVLSTTASSSNVWKPPVHLQGDSQQHQQQQQQQQHQQQQGGWGMMFSPLPGDSYYQQLLATSQIQQQNMMLTMLNQCCQLLWLQQRDLQALRSAVHALQERSPASGTEPAEAARCSTAGYPLFLPTQEDVQQLNNCFPSTPALNNQVPPGNRANNYWDNFRSYSRQNLLSSTGSKSNEGAGSAVVGGVTSHSPSPLVERSHNSLQEPALSMGAATLPALQPEHSLLPGGGGGRKEKLNADQSQRGNSLAQRSDADCSSSSTAVKKKRHPNPKITSMPPRNTHNGLQAGRPGQEPPVYEEVAALISANQSRPHFLLQLFRQLRALHSDPAARQNALRSTHHLHLMSQSTPREDREVEREVEREEGLTACSPTLQYMKMNGFKSCATAAAAVDWTLPSLLNDKGPASCSHEVQCQDVDTDGAGSVVPELLPRNAAWKMKDLLSAPPDLQLVAQGQGHGGAEWHVQSMVAELRTVLQAHQEDTCTPALLESLRHATVRLVPQQQEDSYCCSQLDALLRNALLPFQHCRLANVVDQLLSVVADVLQGEMNFLQQAVQLCAPVSSPSLEEEAGGCRDVLAEPQEQLTDVTPTAQGDTVVAAVVAEVYNGDLAEADQSCHNERDGADTSGDIQALPSCVEESQAAASSHTSSCSRLTNPTEAVDGDSSVTARTDSEDWEAHEWTLPRSSTPGTESP